MAPVAHGKRMGQWSSCSLDQMRGFVRTLSEACFDLLSPKRYTINMTELPGAKLTKLRLCELTYPGFSGMSTYSKSENAKECSVWCCPAGYNGRCLHVALTDGMECANGYHCLKHECVRKGTHQTPGPASPTTRPTTTTARTRRTPSTRRNWWPYWPYWPYMGQDKTSPDSKSTYQSRMDAV
uniref:Putative metalloprotease n=1 Tax=Ixodes ricinus TaxID=34613 RepID=A0A0K8R387_IXORI